MQQRRYGLAAGAHAQPSIFTLLGGQAALQAAKGIYCFVSHVQNRAPHQTKPSFHNFESLQ